MKELQVKLHLNYVSHCIQLEQKLMFVTEQWKAVR